jgi:PAS domain S-box-containing protein
MRFATGIRSWNIANLKSPFHTVFLVCLVATVFYLAAKLSGMLLMRPHMVWPLWPCNVLLVSVLVLVQRRIWPIIIATAFAAFVLYDLQEGMPIRSIGFLILSDAVEVLTAALCLSYSFNGVPQLNTVKGLAKYSLFAVILAPFAGVCIGALSSSGSYWTNWRISFLSEALGFLILMPAILGLAGSIQAWTPKPRAFYLETTLLLAVLSIFCYFTFVTTGKSTSPALLYSLVPFLLWSALRFGSIGTSASAMIVASLSLWGAVRGRGPFVALGPAQSVLSLQLFLFFTSAPFLVLAALIEERKRAEAESREAQRIAHVGNWLMDKKSSAVTWSEEAYRIHGFDPKLPQPSYQEISRMFTPESWTRLTGALNEGFRSGLFPEMDLELLRPDGSKRWVADRGEAIRDATGRITQLRGSIQDITDRKQAEQVAQQLVTINHELELARQIQLSLLPSGTPKIEGLDIAARYLPMSAVAGDFYDFIVMDEKCLGILIADVSGHGLPAALIASMLKVALAGQIAHAADPGKVLSGLNQALCGKLEYDFVTAAYLFVDTEKNAISYAGAGHPPLLMWHRSAGRAEELEENGLILGRFSKAVYSALQLPIEAGDRGVLCTDGILETMNPSEELFGTERFMRFMEKNHALGAGVFADALVDELSRWSGRHPGEGQNDDITLLTIDFKSHG